MLELAVRGDRGCRGRGYECGKQTHRRAEGDATAPPTGEWRANYARELDNFRAALDWAFSPGGDSSIGVALTTAAVPFGFVLCRQSALSE
jgi:hypothetical protein